jgi:drug/metabolite transporter (DMT)-like permease
VRWRSSGEAPHARGAALGLASAALFGVSAPLTKRILESSGPLVTAAGLYIGAGLGLLLVPRRRRAASPGPPQDGRAVAAETPLRRADVPLVVGAVIAGGILGPILLMIGLKRVSAVSGSLLLNLETPLTILLAVIFFGEHLGARQAGAALLIILGAALAGHQGGEIRAEWLGVASIAAASLSWSIDTNLSQRLSLRDPLAYARIKLLAGGCSTLGLALIRGEGVPRAGLVGATLLIGSVSYGLSSLLFIRALRVVGAARVAAYFATAPFLGALAAVPILGERLHREHLAAMALMAIGALILFREEHEHLHDHETLEHEHAHSHDVHHRHEHGPDDPAGEPHAHRHQHEPLRHAHPHAPDMHHRHPHP